MATLKAILFDLDMTLVDSSALDEWRRLKFWKQVCAKISEVNSFSAGSIAAHELPARARAAGLKVAIITASPRQYAELVAKRFGIVYDALVAYHDTAQHKPDPEPLTKALELLGVNANEAVHVGDAAVDVQASYHAGVFSIGAGWGVRDFEALSSAAPDVLIMDPSTLLTADLGRLRYFAEAYVNGIEPAMHGGSYLPCGAAPERHALGRYHPREDPRHAFSSLSNLLLDFKSKDDPAQPFAKALAGFITALDWKPNYVVSVPPKPSQTRNRFAALFEASKGLIKSNVHLLSDGLRCLKEIENYKGMAPSDRAAAVRGAFASKYTWRKNRVLLVDDVLTTGETVAECARVILASDAAEVRIVALGRDQQVLARKMCNCGRPMRVRTNKRGEKFWGCSGYPNDCQRTENI